MKQFIRAIDKNSSCLQYVVQKMVGICLEKIKDSIFNCPQIRQLTKDPKFVKSMNEKEIKAWMSFVLVMKKFLRNYKAENYVKIVNCMLDNFRDLCCNILPDKIFSTPFLMKTNKCTQFKQ